MKILLMATDKTNDNPTAVDFSFSGTLPPGVSFARASNASYFDASGAYAVAGADVPRFDVNPDTLELKGVLIEEQRENLVRYSIPDHTHWTNTGADITDNDAEAPDGTTTATKVADNSSNSAHVIKTPTLSFTSGAVYTFSVFAKAGTATAFQMYFKNDAFDSSHYANFDLTNGTVSASSGMLSTSITPVGNGWYRCTITKAANSTVSSSIAYPGLINNTSAGRQPTYIGSGQYLHLWGAQIEIGSSVSSGIQTSGSPATRAADVLSFTIPSGLPTLRYVFDDDSTQDVSVGAGSYTVPADLNRAWIKRIVGGAS